MKCSILLYVGALVVLAASKPTSELNINHSSLEVSSVVAIPMDAVGTSELKISVVPASEMSNARKRVRRTVWSDGKKCSTGKIRVGQNCMPCALIQKSNPHACKNQNETLDSQMATPENLPQQSNGTGTSSPSTISSSDWLTSEISIKFTSSRSSSTTTSSPVMTTIIDSTGSIEVSRGQSTLLGFNAPSQFLAPNCLFNLTFVYLILYM